MTLPKNRVMLILAATLLLSPILFATPASAEKKVYRRVVSPRRVVNTRVVKQRVSRPVVVQRRVVRLGNGDFRLPHGEIVSSRRVVRLRNQGYYRLPNGDIIVPTQELVPARNVVRLSRDTFRLPNGVIVKI